MDQVEFDSRTDFTDLQQGIDAVKQEAKKVIKGQDDMVDLILIALLSDGHVLIEGVPGIAKTLTSKIIAKTISTEFSRIQFTPDLMPSDVTGTSVFNVKTSEFEFKPGPVFSNIVLIDEVNRAPAKTQAALFEVMEEHQISVDGTTYQLKPPFIILATQNPIDLEGTYRLPEAQLDRFLFKIIIDYPSLEEEEQIIGDYHQRRSNNLLEAVEPVLKPEKLLEYRQQVFHVHAEQNMIRYIAEIVSKTRNTDALFMGASPRASLAILNSAKAKAAIFGRDFITPEDVKFIAPSVLRHRVLLNPESELEGVTPSDVVRQVIDKVEIPR